MTWWQIVLIVTLPPVFWVGLVVGLLWLAGHELGAADRAWLKDHKADR